ncbi:MAG: outer membrane protein transport protein [Betaproteobacteria bacterium]|nr:outer membrane protein transport protein [Betaproteobacteria bacterium]
MKLKTLAGILAVAGLAMPGMASATNGMSAMGVGVKEQAMGGASIAFAQSAMAGATNPAAMSAVGDRIDFGVNLFVPKREANDHAAAGGSGDSNYHSGGNNNFIIPEFGYNMMMGEKMSLGIVVYGNGGMNTTYGAKFFGGNPTYSNIEQLFIAPTMSFKIAPNHSIGVSLNLVRQTAEFKGLANFAAITPSGTTNNLTDVGQDVSYGAGLRLGYLGQLSPTVSAGAFYQPKTRMDKFDKYKELFAEQGGFDIPATYGLGLAVKASDKVTVAADLSKIDYSEVKSIANLNNSAAGVKLGTDNGPGFGWKDITVFKLGVAYDYRPDLTLRAGWNHGDNPLQNSETNFNILAPATITDHLSFGATWVLANKSELSVTYWHGFNKEVKGTGAGAGTADLKMYQDSVGAAYGWKF